MTTEAILIRTADAIANQAWHTTWRLLRDARDSQRVAPECLELLQLLERRLLTAALELSDAATAPWEE